MNTNAATTNSLNLFEQMDARFLPPGEHTSVFIRVSMVIALAVAVHLIVKLIHSVSAWTIKKRNAKKTPFGYVTENPKFVTLTQLIVSAVTFTVYFAAVGLALIAIFKFNDTVFKTYLSSAAVIGLALSFGLQGMVQDVVTGITLILSDAMDVGDIVDLSGTIGRVELIGLRFTKVINFYNQEIFVPNRNIANVARFPRDGIYAYADVQISRQADMEKVTKLIRDIAGGVWAQFGAIILWEPEVGTVQVADPGGWSFVRVQFKIWPGQTLIETVFRPQVVNAMKTIDANYADWMVPVTYRAITVKHQQTADPAAQMNP